ncbi:MAG: family 16 glycoside hydrolase [Flavobacteriaceae bacterium]
MKKFTGYLVLAILLFASCKEQKKEVMVPTKAVPMKALPFQSIDLSDLGTFEQVTENWKTVGNVYADRSKSDRFTTYEGSGVLVNNPMDGAKDNLFTIFEHGDMELELDVMMHVGSNSGLYFQSRYEIQLYDSWGIVEPGFVDMGGIYERWDATKEKGLEGYEGHPPKVNAAKSPGLWQHIKVVFHAPKFDAFGTKIKNAVFEEVWLNGVLIQENSEVTGPTRAAAFDNETVSAPLMIQGDHGPVAFKNIKYKLYGDHKITFSDLTVKAYESPDKYISSLDSLEVLYYKKTDSISPITMVDRNGRTILEYEGMMGIPKEGDYLFDMKVNGGAILVIDKDTLIDRNGNYTFDSLGLGKVNLKKGSVPFRLVYNKHAPWIRGFELYVEGPEMQRYSIQQPNTLADDPMNSTDFLIDVTNEPVTQRSFWMHEGVKRTHCIAVGLPQGIHYSYDLQAGSLLQLWDGDFLDATEMWLSRGEKQLAASRGFTISIHGDPEFAFLPEEGAAWPQTIEEDADYRQLGYEFDEKGAPTFMNKIKNTLISNQFIPSAEKRMMNRSISVDGDAEIWHKIADGEHIEQLPDGTFVVNDESYFVDFTANSSLKAVIRNSMGKDELVVKIPAGKQNMNYTIIW